ncbi:MAG: AIR synthase-related protein, partial [Sphingomicrobium sp.]
GGVEAACEAYRLPLVGGDTIALPPGAPRVLGMTAIGKAGPNVPARGGGKPGDALWLAGFIGDSASGLAQLKRNKKAAGSLVDVYRRPVPLLAAGQAIAPHANAMLDVSDGLLIDALRLAEASQCVAGIDLGALCLSPDFVEERGASLDARLFAATGGDDYALLAALPAAFDPSTLNLPHGTTMARIGSLTAGLPALALSFEGEAITTPETLGHEHEGSSAAPMADRP